MRVESACMRRVLALLLAGGSLSAVAFEPGTTRICEPSADRSRFECRDAKSGAVNDEAPRRSALPDPAASPPAEPAVAEPPAQAAARTDPAEARARSLPNYLMQNPTPLSAPSAAIEAREPATPPADSAAAARAAPVQAEPTHVPSSLPAAGAPDPVSETEPASTPDPAFTTEPVAMPETASTPEPEATPETASTLEPVATPEPASTRDRSPAPTAVATSNAEPGMPATEATQAETLRTAPGPRRDAAAFRRLDSAHYTLEIARARSASELGALVVALDGVGGALYLIGLRTPDGVSHSLVWSDFPSIEAARAARGTLPPDVAVTSGWPRRIGPLQAELIDP